MATWDEGVRDNLLSSYNYMVANPPKPSEFRDMEDDDDDDAIRQRTIRQRVAESENDFQDKDIPEERRKDMDKFAKLIEKRPGESDQVYEKRLDNDLKARIKGTEAYLEDEKERREFRPITPEYAKHLKEMGALNVEVNRIRLGGRSKSRKAKKRKSRKNKKSRSRTRKNRGFKKNNKNKNTKKRR